MATEDLPENLRLLCSYSRSVTEICRQMGMNRQQFNKYLSGKMRPSLQNLRRISDHFGLEESEILMDHSSFREIIAIKRPVYGELSSLSDRVRQTLMLSPYRYEELKQLLGYYHNYYCPQNHPGKILRGLLQVFDDRGVIFSRNFERYPTDKHRYTQKFNGIWTHTGDKLLILEREATIGKVAWMSILYPHERNQESLMYGLSIGVSDTSSRNIIGTRLVLEHLGKSKNIRAMLSKCGLYNFDDLSIDKNIRDLLQNEQSMDEPLFDVRL